jgi:hypothetical protein
MTFGTGAIHDPPMTSPTTPNIATATEEEVRSGVLGRHLRQFNYGFVGEYPAGAAGVPQRQGCERRTGGRTARLRLPELAAHRCALGGRGRTRPTTGHAPARSRSARHENWARSGAALETFWQARGFYLKQGYEEYGRIDDYVKGFYLASMKKKL